jgi:hypothetical protein
MPPISERVGAVGMEPATPTAPIQAPVAHFPPATQGNIAAGFIRCPLPPLAPPSTLNFEQWRNTNKAYPKTVIYPASLT